MKIDQCFLGQGNECVVRFKTLTHCAVGWNKLHPGMEWGTQGGT